MTPKATSSIKVFCLFLLKVGVITFVVVFAKQFLQHRNIESTLLEILDFILSIILVMGYISSWWLLRDRLKEIHAKH